MMAHVRNENVVTAAAELLDEVCSNGSKAARYENVFYRHAIWICVFGILWVIEKNRLFKA
jgi:hypothetical protein